MKNLALIKACTDGDLFDYNKAMTLLKEDFVSKLDKTANSRKDLNVFERIVAEFKTKFTSLSNKVPTHIGDNQWNWLYATYISKMRDEYFQEELEKRKQFNKKKKHTSPDYVKVN